MSWAIWVGQRIGAEEAAVVTEIDGAAESEEALRVVVADRRLRAKLEQATGAGHGAVAFVDLAIAGSGWSKW